jgi:AraC-like DNA-binding protein
MDYVIDGRPLRIPPERLVLFWAGIPHQTTAIDYGAHHESRQCNVYLPLDSFLHMPKLGRLTETMMGGGIVALSPETIGEDTLKRWYQDYRSGDAERADILREEIALMLRRAAATGWDDILPPWIEPDLSAPRQATPLRYVVAMLRYILENLTLPLRAEDVAKVVGLHPNYALNLFTSVMNVSPHKFVVRMRLIRARSLLFEGNLSDIAVARNRLATSLHRHAWDPADIENAQLLLSELATNAVLHAKTSFTVTAWVDGVVSVAVTDASPTALPAIVERAPGQGGMGMRLVASLAERWGVHTGPDGKSVWFLYIPPGATDTSVHT